MKKLSLLSLVFAGLLMFVLLTNTKAQDETVPPINVLNPSQNHLPRPNLLRQLGLTQDQIAQIRQINQDRKPQIRAAQNRLREANRNLDEAIYADAANDAEIQARLKEVQAAHADVIRIRSLTELAVRRILSPEQLAKFRDVRRQFMEEKKENMPERRPDRPLNTPNNRRFPHFGS